jgi:type VI secretion system secreted protein VgrG
MAALTQDRCRLRVTTPLGKDVLVPSSMTGTEAVSELFLFTVDFLSENYAVKASDLLGKNVTLQIVRADDSMRIINGHVRSFTSLGVNNRFASYRAEIVPALWFLSLSSDCRTFEDMSLTDIVEKVCKAAGVTDIKLRVASPAPKMPYVAQFRETNLHFVTRLLEEAGLYYAFEHTESKHTLIVSDSVAGTIPAIHGEQMVVHSTTLNAKPEPDTVFEILREHRVNSASIALADHELHRPDSTGNASSHTDGARGEMYDYAGDIGANKLAGDAKLRIEAAERMGDVIRGQCSSPSFGAGLRVKLKKGPSDIDGHDFHLIEVTHRVTNASEFGGIEDEELYENSFVGIPAATPFRPARASARPLVHGTHTAKVIGTGGDGAIDVDAKGCVLLEFPWDRGAGKGAKSKHRVYVASVWAGQSWGFIQIPRVGQEVLIEYLDGDVNRPMITGRVYNASHPLPYELPANKTQSGWKSRTLDGGSDNFNEIRFDDKKGKEQIFVQAEYDMELKIKHDRTTKIKNHDTRTLEEGDDTHTVTQGKQTITIKGDQSLTVQSGNRKAEIQTGNDSLKVSSGNMSVDVSTGNITVKAGAGKIAIEAGQEISLKVGANSIKIDMTGITIKGTMVKIEGSAMAEMKSPMTKVEGSGMMEVKGAMTQVKGDGLLIAKGGITMIN